MTHLTEEELIEHYYSKGGGTASRHLEGCAECAEAYDALQNDLAQMMPAEPPTRDASYGERVWQSLAPSLPVYETPRRSWRRVSLWKGLSYAALCALLVAGAFFTGRQWERGRQPRIDVAKTVSPEVKQHVVLVVLSDHLDRSERLLVELKHADADTASPLPEQARTLLTANRICRQNAASIDDPSLDNALDRLDHVLAELASLQASPDPAALARLQNEINADGLLFEVRVLRSRIPYRQAVTAARPNGGKI